MYSYFSFTKIVEEMELPNKIGLSICYYLKKKFPLDGKSFAVSAITGNERKKTVNFMHILFEIHPIHEIISHKSSWNTNRLS